MKPSYASCPSECVCTVAMSVRRQGIFISKWSYQRHEDRLVENNKEILIQMEKRTIANLDDFQQS